MAKGASSIWLGQFALLLLGWLTEVEAKNCLVTPFTLEYKNTIVLGAPDMPASHRSMQWSVGSQRANLGMQLGTTLNSTFLPDAIVCTTTPDRGCVAWRGGLFNTSTSSTWVRNIGDVPFNGSVLNAGWDYLNADGYQNSKIGPLTRFPYGWDTVEFGDRQMLGFPMTVVNDYAFPFGAGMVGLADQSIFLAQAVADGISPTRSWSLDYGLTAKNVPGEVVIGGYNENKATWDQFTNFTVFPDKTKPCPLQVNVTGIKWGSVDLMDGQNGFMACVEPAYWTTIMPLKVQENFNKTMLQAQDIEFWQATWEYYYYNSTNNNNTDFQGLPSGDFTIELDGLTVTVPREEWIYPAVQIDHGSGAWDVIPGSIQTTVGTAGWPDGVDPKLPFLGGPFLSQVYLVVDYETGTFSLAPVNRGSNSNKNLVTLGCDQAKPNSTDPAGGSGSNNGGGGGGKKTNTGAIAGGVVGGVAVIGLIGALLFFRRRTNEKVPVEAVAVTGLTKEQTEAQQMGFHQHPYDAPPAFSPSASPGPYSPPTSPGPYGSVGLASVPLRRPLPGQGQEYPHSSSPPSMQHYYDNQPSYHAASMASEPAELGGAGVSELSAQPVTYSHGAYDDGSMASGQANHK